MHAFPQRIARWSRRHSRLLPATLGAVNVAQIVLLVVHPAGLQQRIGPILLGISLLTLLVLAAAAHQVTHRPTQMPPLAFTATALGGPCDGASWQIAADQLPIPRQVWLPAHGERHLYRLASHRTSETTNPRVTLTYAHHPADMPGPRSR